MPYNRQAIEIEGSISSRSFDDAEVDICNSIKDFLGHDDFTVSYTAKRFQTIGGQTISYEISYTAWSNV